MYNNDALPQALMDYNYPTESLYNYDEWTSECKKFYYGYDHCSVHPGTGIQL